MSYTTERAALVASQLQRIATYNAHQLVGQLPNLEFWLGEAAHALAVLDDYPHRFQRLHDGQTRWVEAHQVRITPLCVQCGGPCEYGRGPVTPPPPRPIPTAELDAARRAIREGGYQLLRRLYRNRWIDEARFRTSCYRLRTSVDLDDLDRRYEAFDEEDIAEAPPAAASTLVRLAELSPGALEQLARITLPAARDHAPEWLEDLDAARAEIAEAMTDDKTALALLDEHEQPIAWIAAGHDWGELWELHPLIVALEHHGRGHGRRLVREVERIAGEAGARTMTLSTSDTVGATSLAGADLYEDLPGQLARFTVHRPHAAAFWLRVGYSVVGVTPDAEGPGQPSIAFARRI